MASVLALTLHQHGLDVTLAVTKSQVGYWTNVSGEQWDIQRQLVNAGIKIHVEKSLDSFDGKNSNLACNYLGEPLTIKVHTVIPVTSRKPNDSIYHDLMARQDQWESAGIKSVRRIGDCEAPGIIAQAIYAGHQVAYKIDNENLVDDLLPFEREHPKFN